MEGQMSIFDQPAPYVAGSATSHAAAVEIEPERANYRERVLRAIANHPGISDERIAEVTGLNPSTVRPRRVELARTGAIELAGFSRTRAGRKCQCWRVA